MLRQRQQQHEPQHDPGQPPAAEARSGEKRPHSGSSSSVTVVCEPERKRAHVGSATTVEQKATSRSSRPVVSSSPTIDASRYRYINADLSLRQEWVNADIKFNRPVQDDIRAECLDALGQRNSLLRFVTNIKIVCNPRKNCVNMIVKQDYQDMIFHRSDRANGNHCCVFLSNKFEPFVIIVILSEAEGGRVTFLDQSMFELLKETVRDFKQRFGIVQEGYYYTPTAERHREASGYARENRSHSHNFHIKLRIASRMLMEHFQIYDVLGLDSLRGSIEVLRYQFEDRVLQSFEQVMSQVQSDFGLT
jgi:hypothetical protein